MSERARAGADCKCLSTCIWPIRAGKLHIHLEFRKIIFLAASGRLVMLFISSLYKSFPQGQFAKQIKDYLSRDPYSHFPFPRSQSSFLRDFPKVNLTVPVTTTSSRTPEVNRDSASPKTVSAAVTLSNLEKGRGEESQWAVRGTPPLKTDQNGVLDRVKSPRPHPSAEAVITKEIGKAVRLCSLLY